MEYIYAALLLHKLGQPVNEGNLKNVIAAAGVQVDEAKVKTLVASLQGVDIAKELENANAITAAPAAGAAQTEPKEEKKEEAPSESAAGLASLFG